MALFPITRPHVGLSISHRTLCAVEVGRDWRSGWRGLRLRQCRTRELPAGLVRPSASDPNVSDVAALSDHLQTLLDGRRSLSVALSLPDLCGRIALFDFETLPAKAAEREALLRWRYQQDLNVPAAETRLAYRVFRTAEQAVIRVLAVAIRPDILDQYERACEEAGLWPVSVGLASLRLFDLYRPAIKAAGRCEELFFLHAAEDSFAFLAVRHDSPVFLRIKPVRNGTAGGPVTSASHLADELVATLQFYADLHPTRTGEADPSNPSRSLFVIGDAVPQAAMDDTTLESLKVQVIPLGWETSPISRDVRTAGSLPGSGLPALAGVLEV